VQEIQPADRIVQRIGRIGKASTLQSSITLSREEEGLNMGNRVAVSAILLVSVALTGVAVAQTSTPRIRITPSTEQVVIAGSPERFTGSVRVQSLFNPTDPSRTSGGAVTFQPGAHSAWHTHPLGQILIVTDGEGWIQQWAGPVQVIRKGDVVWIPPGVKHWHGATPTIAMTHIALQETLGGVAVNWLEQVTNEQYRLSK
jgi:quercetin dioxygenase-like cupin family protein